MVYNLQHDIHQLNYSFDNNLQLDEVVVVVELGHKNMLVVVELGVLVEHIVVQVVYALEHLEHVGVVEHVLVGVVYVVVREVEQMLVVELEKFVLVVDGVELDGLVVVVVGAVEVEHKQVVEVDRLVEWGLQQQHVVSKHI
jgi:hypothetical protein